MADPEVIRAEWDAPTNVQGFTTTCIGGVSEGAYHAFNLGDRVGDNPQTVAQNRKILKMKFALPAEPRWLEQVHGSTVVDAATALSTPQADASYTNSPGIVCAVLTADCLPVLLCDTQGSVVAAVHCGWRSLAAGILPATVSKMVVSADTLCAWLGPAIGPRAFEVGQDVHAAFTQRDPAHTNAFVTGAAGKYYADIYALARRELAACGVTRVSGGMHCTVSESENFYSYRRNAITGRMASLVWLQHKN